MTPTRRLNDGNNIPIVGLGTSKTCEEGTTERAIKYAIDVGYRHFDCAWIYKNEKEVGKAIREKIKEGVVTRKDLFITTKLWNNFHKRDQVVKKLRESLGHLQLTYVDLYLIHWPTAFREHTVVAPLTDSDKKRKLAYSDVDFLETWQGMEDCVRLGYARSIGLANFNSQQIDQIFQKARIKPVVVQTELHPWMNQKKLIKFCEERSIVVVAYCPLGVTELGLIPGFPDPNISYDPCISKIATKYGRTPAKIVLNYLISLGVCVIPRAVSELRIKEYIENIFNFKLDEDDIENLELCNQNKRLSCFSVAYDHKCYPFHLEF